MESTGQLRWVEMKYRFVKPGLAFAIRFDNKMSEKEKWWIARRDPLFILICIIDLIGMALFISESLK